MHEGTPRGAVHTFTMRSEDSKIFPGIARDSGTFGSPSPTDPATLIVTTSHPARYTRTVAVYVPAQYVPGTVAPFIVGADGPDNSLFTALDNLIAEKRLPPMIAISIGNGGGDAQGSERGLEYDTMSSRYAEFVETEVLPLVERQFGVRLTKDPDGRATMGGSSGGSAAFIMAWHYPERYHRVLAYSITAINQQWPHSDATPHGAWELHERLIPNSPVKAIRVWLEVGDRDSLNPNVMRDGMHDWVLASENMARVLATKGYHYQYVFARNAGHVDRDGKCRRFLPRWSGCGTVTQALDRRDKPIARRSHRLSMGLDKLGAAPALFPSSIDGRTPVPSNPRPPSCSRNARPAHPADAGARPNPRVRHRAARQGAVPRRLSGRRELALSRAPAPNAQRLHQGRVGRIRQQPPRAVLHADARRPQAARRGASASSSASSRPFDWSSSSPEAERPCASFADSPTGSGFARTRRA